MVITSPAKSRRGVRTLEASHRPVPAVRPAVILFKPIVEVPVGPAPHPFTQTGPDRNGTRDFDKETRSNETHAFTTGPDARLARRGTAKEA